MLWQAEEFVALLERAREAVRAHVDLARAYVDEGMLVRSDLLRAEVELARVDDVLAQARGRSRVASANLAFRLGADQGAAWTLAPPPQVVPVEPLEAYLTSAADRRDLEAARRLLRVGQLEEKVRRAAYYPRVGIVGRADWVDDHVFGRNGSSTAVMAVASVNLSAGGSDRAALAAARYEAKAGAEDVARFEEGVGLEVRQAWEEAGTATQRQGTAARAVGAAREAARIVQERFRAGVVKMLDLLDADTALRETETRELVAHGEAVAAGLRLAVQSGRPAESALR
jgi:outer membrane protein TolC